jgi:hypothetical protein
MAEDATGFLTSHFDLSGTIYTEDNLRWAREYLLSGIQREFPSWLDRPEGIIGEHWRSTSVFSACFLIELARTIDIIWHHIPSECIPRLNAKIFDLFRCSSRDRQFTELLTELQVATILVELVSPLMIEPLVSEAEFTQGNRPKSPDFAFDLSEERVYSEVTVFSLGILDKWQKAVDQIITTLQKRLMKQDRALQLHLQLPLQELNTSDIIERIWNKMKDRSSQSGSLTIVDKGTIQWKPFPITNIESAMSSPPEVDNRPMVQAAPNGGWEFLFRFKALQENPSGFIHVTPLGISHTSDYLVDRAFSIREPDIAILSEKDIQIANKQVLKAFKNKLQDKRDQFSLRYTHPSLLVIRPGHYRLQGNKLAQMIEHDIWSKRDYAWITGIVLFTSRQGYHRSERGSSLTLYPNPHARLPVSDSLMSLFQDGKQFHNRITQQM